MAQTVTAATLARARAAVDEARASLASATRTAPYAGTVVVTLDGTDLGLPTGATAPDRVLPSGNADTGRTFGPGGTGGVGGGAMPAPPAADGGPPTRRGYTPPGGPPGTKEPGCERVCDR